MRRPDQETIRHGERREQGGILRAHRRSLRCAVGAGVKGGAHVVLAWTVGVEWHGGPRGRKPGFGIGQAGQPADQRYEKHAAAN